MLNKAVHLFDERQERDQTITVRISSREKEMLKIMSGGKGISAFVLSLIKKAYQRRLDGELYTSCNKIEVCDDDVPY